MIASTPKIAKSFPDLGIEIPVSKTLAERRPVHGMAIAYVNAAARIEAENWSNRLIEEIGDHVIWEKSYLDLALLTNPAMRRQATETASTAEVVVLALDGDRELSKVARTWMEEWPRHLVERGPVLIAIYHGSRLPRRGLTATQAFLEKIAFSCALTFLYTQGEAILEYLPFG